MSKSGEDFDFFGFGDNFDFLDYNKSAPKKEKSEKKKLTRRDFYQLCVGFLASLSPDAIATDVPARRYKYKTAAAGFWRNNLSRNREVVRTAVIVFLDRLDNCFCDCAEPQKLLDAIHAMRNDKERLEAEIRDAEPELAATDDLFGEFRSWDYASSKNPAYLKLLRKLEKLQRALHRGNRLERIRRAAVADLCFLAVPAGLIAPDEIANDWGLVYLNDDRTFTLIRDAELQDAISAKNRQLFAQNIAVAATNAVLFMEGVDCRNRKVCFRRIPRRRQRQN
ncbi:MAG: hypothetical protein LBM70_00300 [Victivallales bacterium]|jgi:hypothetical protein|nr:hypothetical protein [Victivallales bacterium]